MFVIKLIDKGGQKRITGDMSITDTHLNLSLSYVTFHIHDF